MGQSHQAVDVPKRLENDWNALSWVALAIFGREGVTIGESIRVAITQSGGWWKGISVDGDSCRVVTPILQTPQAGEEKLQYSLTAALHFEVVVPENPTHSDLAVAPAVPVPSALLHLLRFCSAFSTRGARRTARHQPPK